MTALHPVSLRYQGRPGARVFVVGDFPDWGVRHPMEEGEPGVFTVGLQLAAGLYRYKLLVDDQWLLDPLARVVDRADGYDNAILAVGPSAAPPVSFAPDRQHVAHLEDGRLVVHLEVDEGRERELSALWIRGDAADAAMPLALEEHGRRGGRVFLRARGISSPARSPARLGIDAGSRQLFDLPPPRLPAEAPPPWLAGAVFYGIFLDRWRRGASSGPERRMLAATTPSTPFVFYGGDLDGVRESLGYVADLGVSGIVLSPVHTADSPHRYDARDLMAVDPRLGGERALAALVEACHARGLKIVVDAALTHVSEKHPAFVDLLASQEASPYAAWFRVKRFPVVKRDATTFEHYYNCPDLPWLCLDAASPARAHVIEAALRLASHGVDGLRLDAMDDAPADFWQELRARVKARHTGMLLLGEIVGDGLATRAEGRGVDVATDFRLREALVGFVARRSLDARAFLDHLAWSRHRTGPFEPAFRLSFLDNHDTARLLSLTDEAHLRIGLALLLFFEETAWITYGTEAHLAARRGERPLDSAWPERLAMPEPATVTTETHSLVRRLCRMRREMTTLGAGPVEVVTADGPRLALQRRAGERSWGVDVDVETGRLICAG